MAGRAGHRGHSRAMVKPAFWLLPLALAACHGTSEVVECPASPCTAGGVSVALSLPHPVPLLQPFPVQVQIQGKAEDAALVFAMEGMDMGLNRYRLEPAPEGLRTTAMLPVCTSGRRDWRADIEVGDKIFRFTFEAGG